MIVTAFGFIVDTVGVERETLVRGVDSDRYRPVFEYGDFQRVDVSWSHVDISFNRGHKCRIVHVTIAICSQIRSITFLGWNSAVFHHPLVNAEILTAYSLKKRWLRQRLLKMNQFKNRTVATVISKTPTTIDEGLQSINWLIEMN